MTMHPTAVLVRRPGHLTGEDEGLAALLAAYHLQTEAEKGLPAEDATQLPARYRAEIQDPQTAFAGATVCLALDGGVAMGCVVVTAPAGGRAEIKRLWTDPARRGRGIASALVHEALSHCADNGVTTVRLSVWHWRTAAIALYERLGFRVTDSWDAREGLICMERSGQPGPGTPTHRVRRSPDRP
ncbi:MULTISPECIES: GNAT family N-acetyltransferase [Streptomyces]|uniref:GNAT family N-acetyltransferase n=1 Tax=Streptomyces TaxID=1883 RepID=UPI0029CE7B2C|nr:GNAT family N-acetyltransferase [Streptomyces sp. F8]MDX6761816.1 GNAT family N-acetyltransferase [Streptomyces sp. F8]